jgi:uncharacterized protein
VFFYFYFQCMKVGSRKKIRKLVFFLAAAYCIAGILLYFFQDLLLFHPTPRNLSDSYKFEQPFEEINIALKERNINLVRFRPTEKPKGLVLFFHGNMKNVEHYKKYPSFFLDNKYEIWMHDYPGFGKTTGERTEAIMYQDALKVYELALAQHDPSNIIIYGKSIGTGVASFLASKKACKKLILETPYYSIKALARSYLPIYPVNIMSRYKFPVHEYVKQIRSPLTIFHGTEDEIIPYRQARMLNAENPNSELITIKEGRHNNLASYPIYKTKIDSLLR